MTIDARLAAMAPIDLADMIDAADLQTRVDRKYLLPAAAADRLLAELDGSARVLEIDGRRVSRYTSTYFDTPWLDSYLAAARRRRRRFKVRTRGYLDTAACFLEVKTRNGRGATVKQRVDHPLGAVGTLTDDAARYVRDALADAGIDPSVAGALAPMLRTDYRRCTVYLPQSAARLTIDRALTWCPATYEAVDARPGGASGETCVALGDLVVVETKSPGGPGAADRLLWAAGIRPAPLSKFAVGMALLRAGLPANRWYRMLQHRIRPDLVSVSSQFGSRLIEGALP